MSLLLSPIPLLFENDWLFVVAGILLGLLGYGLHRRRLGARNQALQRETEARQQAEAALQASEARYVKTFLDSPSAVTITRMRDGVVIEANEGFFQLTGYERDEVMGRSVVELGLWQFEDRAAVMAVLEREGHLHGLPFRFQTRQGALRQGHVSVQGVALQGERCLVSVAHDVTEVQRAEQALRESEERYRRLVEFAPVGISVLRLDGHIYFVNQHMLDLYGVGSADEVLGTNAFSYIDAKQQDSAFERAQIVGGGDTTAPVERTIVRRNGERRDVLIASLPLLYDGEQAGLSVITDVTEQKRAERALHESEERYRRLVEAAPVALAVFGADEILRYVNPACVDLLGADGPEAVVGTSVLDYIAPTQHDEATTRMDQMRGGSRVDAVERTFLRLDGTTRQVRAATLPIQYEGEAAFQSVVVDVTEQKQTEQALATSLSLLRSTLEATADGILVVDLDRHVVTYNDRFVELWGLQETAALQAGDSKFVDIVKEKLEDPEGFVARTEARYHDPEGIDADVIRFRDGQVLERYSHPQRIEGQVVGRVWSFRDVTVRVLAEAALQTREAQMRALITNAPVILFALDAEGRFILSEGKGLEKLGFLPGEVVGQSAFTVYADEPEIQQNIRACLGGENRAYSTRIDRFVFETFVTPLFDEVGDVVGVIGVLNDITARQQAEADLRASEEKFSKAFQASPDAILIGRLASGRVLEVNEGFEALSGYSRDEAIGQTVTRLQLWAGPDDARMQSALQTQGRLRGQAFRFQMKTGEVRPCTVSADTFELHGEPSFVALIRDVTEQKRAEEEREALIRELEARNAELERFTYTVSHDLKSPLVTIKGFLGLLRQDALAGNRDRMESDLRRIEGAADRMAQLLNELLELSRIGRIVNASEHIPMTELAHEAVEMVTGVLMAGGVAVDIDPNLPTVFGDRTRLLEVYQNLLDNAARFMDDQPHPRIEVGVAEDDAAGAPVFFVRDNGVGIEPAYHEKVFGLFERLDLRVEGTGVGLALVRRIVEVHGGRIWVESDGPGTGTTFYFTLPAPAGTVSPVRPAP